MFLLYTKHYHDMLYSWKLIVKDIDQLVYHYSLLFIRINSVKELMRMKGVRLNLVNTELYLVSIIICISVCQVIEGQETKPMFFALTQPCHQSLFHLFHGSRRVCKDI